MKISLEDKIIDILTEFHNEANKAELSHDYYEKKMKVAYNTATTKFQSLLKQRREKCLEKAEWEYVDNGIDVQLQPEIKKESILNAELTEVK